MNINLKGYEVEHDEVLVALANTDMFEQIEVGNASSNSSERNSQDKAIGKHTEVPTPLKAEKSLKRHSADTMEVDKDVSTKRPRLSESSKEVLKSAQHSLWDMISKFWKELRRMEAKKAYIYSTLDKHKLATE